MNPVAAAASRLEQWDRRNDWRRFWWAAPPLLLGLGIWGSLTIYHRVDATPLVVVSETVGQTFETGTKPTLVVVDRAGDVTIRSGAAPEVAIAVTRQGAGKTADSANTDLTSLSLHIDDRGGTVSVVTGEEPGRPASDEARSNVEVTVPAGTTVSVVTHMGSVSVSGVAGDIAATADHGDLAVQLDAAARFALFDGAGALHSDFPLATPPAGSDPEIFAVTGDGQGGILSPGSRPAQRLDLHAPNGSVFILRQ